MYADVYLVLIIERMMPNIMSILIILTKDNILYIICSHVRLYNSDNI